MAGNISRCISFSFFFLSSLGLEEKMQWHSKQRQSPADLLRRWAAYASICAFVVLACLTAFAPKEEGPTALAGRQDTQQLSASSHRVHPRRGAMSKQVPVLLDIFSAKGVIQHSITLAQASGLAVRTTWIRQGVVDQ